MNAADVISSQEFLGRASRIFVVDRLEAEYIERSAASLDEPLCSLGTTRKAVALIERLGNHDAAAAIHQIHRRGILEADSDSKVQRRQAGCGRFLVVSVNDVDHLAREHAAACNTEFVRAFVLKHRKNYGIALNEHLGR